MIPRAGDQVFWKSTILIQKIFDGKSGHVETVRHYNCLSNCTTTYGSNWDGCKTRTYFDLQNDPEVMIMRPVFDINEDVMRAVIDDYADELRRARKTGYSAYGLVRASFHQAIDRITWSLWNKMPILPDDRNVFCSECSATILKRYNPDLKFNRKGELDEPTSLITPGNLVRSFALQVIKPYG